MSAFLQEHGELIGTHITEWTPECTDVSGFSLHVNLLSWFFFFSLIEGKTIFRVLYHLVPSYKCNPPFLFSHRLFRLLEWAFPTQSKMTGAGEELRSEKIGERHSYFKYFTLMEKKIWKTECLKRLVKKWRLENCERNLQIQGSLTF